MGLYRAYLEHTIVVSLRSFDHDAVCVDHACVEAAAAVSSLASLTVFGFFSDSFRTQEGRIRREQGVQAGE